jgi:hypothetical protein
MSTDHRHQLSFCGALLASLGLSVFLFAVASGGTAPEANAGPIESVLLSPLVADITVGMSVEPAVAPPGNEVSCEIDYRNLGPDTSGVVTITSLVPPELVDFDYSSIGAIVTQTGVTSYTWMVAPLAMGEGGVITVTGTADLALAGSEVDLICTASIEAESVDPESANDAAQGTVLVDGVAPEPPVLEWPPDGALIADNTPVLAWRTSLAPDTAGYELEWNGHVHDMGAVIVFPIISPLPDGINTWTVRAYDEVGNQGLFTDTWSFQVDATPPAVDSHWPSDEAVEIPLTEGVTITFTESIEAASAVVYLDPDPGRVSVSWNPGGGVATMEHGGLAAWTTYTVTVETADDLAGNPLDGRPVSWRFTTVRTLLYLPLLLGGESGR